MSKEPKVVSINLKDSDLYDDNKKQLKKEISVIEISNGFILEETIYGYKGKGKEENWFSETTKTYYKENPLKDEKSPVAAIKLADHF